MRDGDLSVGTHIPNPGIAYWSAADFLARIINRLREPGAVTALLDQVVPGYSRHDLIEDLREALERVEQIEWALDDAR